MKTVKILIVAVVIGFLGYMAYAINLKYSEGKELRNRISTLPPFRFERIGEGFFTEDDLDANTPLILFYFNSSCTFCRSEANEIRNKLGRFSGFQLVFVSTEDKILIKKFSEEFGLNGKGNDIFLRDSDLEFSRIFGVITVPATYIYNTERQLIKEFKGAVKIASLLEAIQEKPEAY